MPTPQDLDQEYKTDHFYQRHSRPLSAIKDFAITFIIVAAYEFPILQTSGVSLTMGVFLALDAYFMPFTDKKENYDNLFVELVFLLISINFFILSFSESFLSRKSTFYFIGYSTIFLILVLVLRNIIFAGSAICKAIKHYSKKFFFKGSQQQKDTFIGGDSEKCGLDSPNSPPEMFKEDDLRFWGPGPRERRKTRKYPKMRKKPRRSEMKGRDALNNCLNIDQNREIEREEKQYVFNFLENKRVKTKKKSRKISQGKPKRSHHHHNHHRNRNKNEIDPNDEFKINKKSSRCDDQMRRLRERKKLEKEKSKKNKIGQQFQQQQNFENLDEMRKRVSEKIETQNRRMNQRPSSRSRRRRNRRAMRRGSFPRIISKGRSSRKSNINNKNSYHDH